MAIPVQPRNISAEELWKRDHLRRLNRAYTCYGIVGLGALIFAIVGRLVRGQPEAEGYGMLLLWLVLPMLGALLTILVLTLQCWRYRPLLVLGMVHILFVVAMVVAIERLDAKGGSETPLDILVLGYGVSFILAWIWWIAIGKWPAE